MRNNLRTRTLLCCSAALALGAFTLSCATAQDGASGGGNAAAGEVEEGFVAMFDGESLDGWAYEEEWFSVRDGAIVAGSMDKEIPRNRFIVYEKQYYNFELRLQVKINGGRQTNGGMQFRSTFDPETGVMAGYQADVGHVYWGRLYDEARRRQLLTEHPEGFDIEKDVNHEGWNDFVIRAEGPRLRVWLNGKLVSDYTEQDEEIAKQRGFIGLQVHAGPASERLYRNIRIKELE